MAAQQARRNTPKKKQPDSRTKFDVWLESHLETGEIVTFIFKEDPILLLRVKSEREAKILTVDRYMIYMEISSSTDGDSWMPVWVAKDNIISAA